ncbi:hypothetical protein RZS08_47925, partial [Arthrospira platensis SPKY1]|nr:hypothetical protein [Arthrospira platensis SPKY1]
MQNPKSFKANIVKSVHHGNVTSGQWASAGLILAFLALFLMIPVMLVFYTAFVDPSSGGFTLMNFYDIINNELMRRSFWNSVYVASMSVVLASIFALPLAYFTSRFDFRGS